MRCPVLFVNAKHVICKVFLGCLMVTGSSLVSIQAVHGQPPVRSPFFGESLRRTSITLTVENQAFSEVLRRILQSVNLGSEGKQGGEDDRPWSLWLDRRIDPSQKVKVTAADSPAAKVILDVVEPLDLAVYPLPGILLVGRREWVETTLALLPSPPRNRRPGDRDEEPDDLVSVTWPTGTTAAEALAIVVTGQPQDELAVTDVPTWLPHDIWPQGELRNVDRTLAAALVLAQFDLTLQRTKSLKSLLTQPRDSKPSDQSTTTQAMVLPSMVKRSEGETNGRLNVSTEFVQSYPDGSAALPIRQVLKDQDAKSSVRASGDVLTVRTVANNHVIVVKTLWSIAPAKPPRAQGNEAESVFDLKIVNKPVGEVLRQLVTAAGKRIEFGEATELASERLVSLDAIKKTLPELTQEVAEQVGLVITWNEADVLVSKP